MKVTEVNQDTFENEVLKSDIPVLVDFNATWCGPSKMMKPVLEEIAEENPSFKIVAIDVDDNDELAEDYYISSIPCLVAIKGGEEFDRKVGLVSKDAIVAMMEG